MIIFIGSLIGFVILANLYRVNLTKKDKIGLILSLLSLVLCMVVSLYGMLK